jgi:hypothetical protein
MRDIRYYCVLQCLTKDMQRLSLIMHVIRSGGLLPQHYAPFNVSLLPSSL